ncbi:MAG: hypothetical protein HLUCCA04_02980 [Oceanicaulis sp. HLUCCA04]|nr:MAG: hypothetical protein HLUCCA04_02980 [Oceanicaulis sp. HLUCCA04]
MGGDLGEWLSAGLKTSSELTGKLKGLRDLERQLDQVELKKELLDVSERVLELREALLQAREEIHIRDQAISDLEAALAGKQSVRRINGLLRELDSDGCPTEVRICDRCNSVEDKLVPMNRLSEGRFICPNCKNSVSEYNAPPLPDL